MAERPADMCIPLLDLRRHHAALRPNLSTALERVVDSHLFILGAEVDIFERDVARTIGAGRAVGMSSGTDALLAALMALRVGVDDEVITSPFTFFATAGVIARLGARPVFGDIDARTLNIHARPVAACITDRTRAILPVHLFGRICEMDSIRDAARERGVAVIEDAAQAIGASDAHGRAAGTIGDIGCFSFFPSKNLGAFGDAGLCTTNDDQLAQKLRMLRVHGMEPKYHHSIIGGNFRLDAIQAAVLRVKLPYLAGWNEQRRRNARLYAAAFASAGLLEHLSIPPDEPGHVYHQYVIRVPQKRDELRSALTDAGIGTDIYYPIPLHLQPCFEYLGYRPGSLPEAEKAATEVLALPIFPELTEAEIDQVVTEIARFFGTRTP